MKLYKAQNVVTDDDAEEYEGGYVEQVERAPWTEVQGAPAGWDAYCDEKWGEPHQFFIPSDRPIYRSRSSAQARVNLINRWGGNAVLVEADVDWVPVKVANAERRNRRRMDRVKQLHMAAEKVLLAMEPTPIRIVAGEHRP